MKDPDVSWWGFIRRTKQPELPVVLLEDIGALDRPRVRPRRACSSRDATGNPRFDAMGSVMIGLLLIVIAIVLIVEMKSLLIGESASDATRDSIAAAISASPGVDQLIHMRTEHLGPDEILVGAKVEYSSELTADQLVAAINDTEDAIRAAVPTATVIYLEPDLVRSDHPDLPHDDTPS